jgi:hypothetical protein
MRADHLLSALLSEARRAQTRRANVVRLSARKRTVRVQTLERAVSRMHIDDLDAAWQMALRGDVGLVLQRIGDHVTQVQQEVSGTPWRMTGWLTRRT